MSGESRKIRLCRQDPAIYTGIDFVQIVDKAIQTEIHVYFIIEPHELDTPIDGDIPNVTITSLSSGEPIELADEPNPQVVPPIPVGWIDVTMPDGSTRKVLRIFTQEPGDFSLYEIFVEHVFIDPFFAKHTFSFKQACDSGTDCKIEHECPDSDEKDVNIDYLARDFVSFRQALLDFAVAEYPEWEFQTEADMAVMLLEIMAALGDEFAYIQDRYAQEAYLPTATQPQSVINLARLVDYQPFHGQAATTLLAIGVSADRTTAGKDFESMNTPDRAFAMREGAGVIPFECLENIEMKPDWNEVEAYNPDDSVPCLAIGATHLFLEIEIPADPSIWVGRKIILRSGLAEPEDPDRSWQVEITAVNGLTDELADPPVKITRIEWDEAEALPFEMPLKSTRAFLNCVQAIAGETILETFRVGTDEDIRTRYAGHPKLGEILSYPQAIERQGACISGQRDRIIRYGLLNSQNQGLAWTTSEGGEKVSRAAIILQEFDVTPIDLDPGLIWEYEEFILDGDAEQPAYTIEHGIWKEVVRYQKPSGDIVHRDYATSEGFTIRFADGAFARTPTAGTVFRAAYLSAPGLDANLPSDTVKHITRPGTEPPEIGIPGAIWVTNPFPIRSARRAESLADIRLNAPEAFRVNPRRAVRTEDYKTILDMRDDVQQSNGNARWTGSWSTDFISVDPFGTTTLKDDHRQDLEQELDCIRQAGRDVCLKDAEYLPLDLEVSICADPKSSNAKVIKKIRKALISRDDPESYFHPDQFSFGTHLLRSHLEAAIQNVPGVKAVESLKVRIRGRGGFVPMSSRILLAPHQIFELSNDPGAPHKGYLEIHSHGGG